MPGRIKDIAVEPVEPTNARTLSRDDTVIATVYEAININAVNNANRGSLTLERGLQEGHLIWEGPDLGVGRGKWEALPGRHANTLSRDPRQGWAWSGYEKSISTTMAALPNVAAAEFSYIEMMFPVTLDPKVSRECFRGTI